MMYNYKYELFTYRNTKAQDKPNEDVVAYDSGKNVGVLLDGVSRDRENGVYPEPSPAQVASKRFADVIFEEINQDYLEDMDVIWRIKKSIQKANDELKEYNKELAHAFPAGTVGIVFAIADDCLHYGYIGDCYATIIRNGSGRCFTECQTKMVAKHKGEFTSDEIRFDLCNHIAHPCGYGVWDGNSDAMDFVKYGSIGLKPKDVLILYTDGLEAEVENLYINELVTTPLEQLFTVNPKANQDDRTCIRITVQ